MGRPSRADDSPTPRVCWWISSSRYSAAGASDCRISLWAASSWAVRSRTRCSSSWSCPRQLQVQPSSLEQAADAQQYLGAVERLSRKSLAPPDRPLFGLGSYVGGQDQDRHEGPGRDHLANWAMTADPSRCGQEVAASVDQVGMDEWFLPARRRFVAECAGISVVALFWLACLVLGVGGPRATQAISNFGLIAAAGFGGTGLPGHGPAQHRPAGADVEAAGDLGAVLGQRPGRLDLVRDRPGPRGPVPVAGRCRLPGRGAAGRRRPAEPARSPPRAWPGGSARSWTG